MVCISERIARADRPMLLESFAMIAESSATKYSPGEILDHFRIIEQLGAGGMGVVYKCVDTRLDRVVALKVLPSTVVADPERRRRLAQEAKAASALNHPNIVTIYEINTAKGVDFIAMEYVEGRTLENMIGRHGIPLGQVLAYGTQIADALGKAHAAGVVHRDLKPSNIMITREDNAKILDFGLAKLVTTSQPGAGTPTMSTVQSLTMEGHLLGTAAYMSPEQAEGKPVDARTDIFSFGLVLYEMLTGRRPFEGDTKIAMITAMLHEEPAPPSQILPELPGEVERMVMRCLRKDPQRRWQSMADLKLALLDLKEESDSGGFPLAVAVAPVHRIRAWFWGVSLLLLLVLAGIGWRLYRSHIGVNLPEITRVTFEPRMAVSPAISPDGKMLAFVSEREGNYEIYVQQINGRQVIRLTHNEAWDGEPSFSPDGAHIVFSSLREGGGIYEIDTLGGAERKIADGGRQPRYSPDGTMIAFLKIASFSQTAKIFLVGADGNGPRPFHAEFEVPPVAILHAPPLWSADGKSLLFEGVRDGDWKNDNWWIAPIDGSPPVAVGMPAMKPGSALQLLQAWAGDYLYYSEGTTVGGVNIFRVPLGQEPWRITGPPQQLSSGPGVQLGTSVANDGRLVYTSPAIISGFWSIPLKASQAIASGDVQQLPTDAVSKGDLTVAADGSKLAYAAALRFPTTMELRVRDLPSGREQTIPISGRTLGLLPRLNADGSKIAFRDLEAGKPVSYVADASGANRVRVCEGCSILDFFPHADGVLAMFDQGLFRLTLTDGRRTPILERRADDIDDAGLAPEGKRVALISKSPNGSAALYVVPVRDKAVPAAEWTFVAEDKTALMSPRWSPDGNLLYYLSTRDGNLCAWAQPVDRQGKPVGDPVAVFHSHHVPGFWMWPGAAIGVTPDRLYLLMGEARGDIWTMNVEQQ